jgi:hypothetical protein
MSFPIANAAFQSAFGSPGFARNSIRRSNPRRADLRVCRLIMATRGGINVRLIAALINSIRTIRPSLQSSSELPDPQNSDLWLAPPGQDS